MLIQIRVCRDINSLYCYVAANAPQCVGNEICSNLQDHGLHDKFVRKNEKSNRAWMTPCLTLVKAVPLEACSPSASDLGFPLQEKAPETMAKDFPAITKRISDDIKKLRKDIPDTLNGFSALANAALRGGALDKKTKELVALALGVAAHCDGCIGFHVEALVKLGASRQEIEEALGMAVYMGGGPALMYAADAIAAFEQFYELANTEAIED
jgi:AhpD family alkylhydroperoxidase